MHTLFGPLLKAYRQPRRILTITELKDYGPPREQSILVRVAPWLEPSFPPPPKYPNYVGQGCYEIFKQANPMRSKG